ncbi:hypothetical protein [Streptomyces sp. NPDC051109]|uniref:hypothetical protein n=1 Tax=Streptomyces sp. NPDC051109 TaxID=3365642 RepID=UPI0010661D52
MRRLFTEYDLSTTTVEGVHGGYRTHHDTETLGPILLRALTSRQAEALAEYRTVRERLRDEPARPAGPSADSGWRGVPRTGSGRPGVAPVPGSPGREGDRGTIAARPASAGSPSSTTRPAPGRCCRHAPDFAPAVRTALPAGVRAPRAAALNCLGSPR